MNALLRLLDRLLDAVMAPPGWQFETASYGTDSRTRPPGSPDVAVPPTAASGHHSP